MRILWHLHLMLRQLGLVVDIVEGNVDLCSRSSGLSKSLWKVASTCDGVSQTQHMIKKLGLVLLHRDPAFRILVHFSGRLRLCTSLTNLSRSVGTRDLT